MFYRHLVDLKPVAKEMNLPRDGAFYRHLVDLKQVNLKLLLLTF